MFEPNPVVEVLNLIWLVTMIGVIGGWAYLIYLFSKL